MNEEKWVLAIVKRHLLDEYNKAKNDWNAVMKHEYVLELLNVITKAESDAVLGTPSMVEDWLAQLDMEKKFEEEVS